MSTRYAVIVEQFAERHFISKYRKKYKGAWDATWSAMHEEFMRIETLIGETNIVETISDQGDIKICKTEFRVHGTKESRHGSGNRCIVAVRKSTCVVHVLIVYHKNYLGGGNETPAWNNLVREHYPEYAHFLG